MYSRTPRSGGLGAHGILDPTPVSTFDFILNLCLIPYYSIIFTYYSIIMASKSGAQMSLKRKRQMAEDLLGGMTEAAAVEKF